MARIEISEHDALVIVDVQKDFCEGGALAVPEGDEVVATINRIVKDFPIVVQTQDWHTPGHVSFASTHGKEPFETIELDYGPQVLWPDHCVMGSKGAEFHDELDVPQVQMIVRTGFHPDVDSYSGFVEADHRTETGLTGYLKERSVRRILVCGLATDFCVRWTAVDGRKAGFEVVLLEDACRGIDLNGSMAEARAAMDEAGVVFSTTDDLQV